MPQATLALRAVQQTALTPRLQQSLHLLQLSSNDFQQELEQALATNPFLEVSAGAEAGAAPDAGEAWQAALCEGKSAEDSIAASLPSQESALDERTVSLAVAGADSVGSAEPFESGIADDVDAIDDRTSGSDGFELSPLPERSAGAEATDIGAWAEDVPTLRAHLQSELSCCRLDARAHGIAAMVVEALDDDGYLRQDLADVVERFAFDPAIGDDELAEALDRVQRLGPPGIAARNVSECLSLQLQALEDEAADSESAGDVDRRSIALAIAHDHLDLLAARDWTKLRRRLGCPLAAVTEAAALIRSLDPRPGSAFDHDVAQAIVPDVIVRRGTGGWQAEINPAVVPQLALNRVYAALFHESRGGERQPLGQQLQEARWFLRNAAQRFVTIRRVARVIVAEQSAFLDYGDIAIRPLLLRQVADQLSLHESTISRAIGNKFMSTPRGVFAFKHFFSRKLATVSGGSCSAASIRAAMRDILDGEDRADPLSDVVLAKRLSAQGLCVARRTVTKYRGLMRIPPVEIRRHA